MWQKKKKKNSKDKLKDKNGRVIQVCWGNDSGDEVNERRQEVAERCEIKLKTRARFDFKVSKLSFSSSVALGCDASVQVVRFVGVPRPGERNQRSAASASRH